MANDRMKIWVKMVYKGYFIEKNLLKQFADLVKLGYNAKNGNFTPLSERYVNIWMGKMSSLSTPEPEGECPVKFQEAIEMLSRGEIYPMDW